MKLPSRFQRNGFSLAKGSPAFGGAVGAQGLPRFKSGVVKYVTI